jgi:hypothetical protein
VGVKWLLTSLISFLTDVKQTGVSLTPYLFGINFS